MYEMETGESKLLMAQSLITARRFAEAERPLLEAVEVFRSSGEVAKLGEVLINLSKVHLCQGQPARALDDLALVSGLEGGQPSDAHGRILFQRGMALLIMGKEEDAHRELTQYIEVSEQMGDEHAQTLGHYYLAMVYERHGEPCMASAELEIAREVVMTEDHYLLARINAFLAHLWLRRLAVEEARSEVEEALRLQSSISVDNRPSSIGIVNLVEAEFLAAKSDWEASREKFELSIQTLRAAGMGVYLETVAHSWYGEILLAVGRTSEGIAHLEQAMSMFEGMGNLSQADRAKKMIANAPAASG